MTRRSGVGLFTAMENGLDMVINLIAMLVAYMFAAVAFTPTVLFDATTLILIFLTLLASSLVYQAFDVNRYVSSMNLMRNSMLIVRANFVFYGIIVALVGIFGADHGRPFLFTWVGIAAVMSTAFLILKKRVIIAIKRTLKKNSFSIRKVIIVGDNTATSRDFVKQITSQPEQTMMIIGYVGDKIDQTIGADKLGSLAELEKILDTYRPDDVVFAIDAYDKRHIIRLVNMCDDRCIKVYFLPVIYGYFKHQQQIEQVGSIPVINIHATPLDNTFNAFIKRAIDIFGSLFLILLTLPVMIAAAIAVRVSSPGPIFFRQERVGKMGESFTMLKFRSMRVNVSSEDGWTKDTDPRKTRVGNFLRKTSIDELPQLFNVLGGTMSLVGPRPEVPYYVDYFKTRIPLYMIKHYVKPGITGYAQIKGLRGDTSIEDRIHCDIEYIENWSLGLDIYILLMTPFHAINKHERYKKTEPETITAPTDEDGQAAALAIPKREKKLIIYAASTMSHINNFHLDYIEKLRADGYTVKIMARGIGADYNIPFEKKLLSPINTACRKDIARIIRRERPDAIILNTSLAAFHIRLALPKGIRPRIINIVHGYLFSENVGFIKRRILILCEKLMAKRTDAVIVMNADDMAASLKYKLSGGKTYMTRGMGGELRAPVNTPESIREEFRVSDRYMLTFVGELSARKNQEFLIKAHAKLRKRIPGAMLLLVGDGALREYYESIIDEYDLADSVILTGQRDDACDIMRAADLYVSASTIEGMPFNLIEALGCGKNILASRVKGHTDLLEERKSGFFFDLNNEDEYVDKVSLIHSGVMQLSPGDIEQRYNMFSKTEVLPETYSIIKEALNEKDASLSEELS